MLDWLTALLIGIMQGTLEWLPVSSSGQTALVMVNLLGIRPEHAISFGLAVHIGTAASVFARYPRQLLGMFDMRSSKGIKTFYWATTAISLACALPILLLLESAFESDLLTGVTVTLLIGTGLVVTGMVLDRARHSSFRPVSHGSYADYLLVGLAQAFAVLPGVSRSGMAISALLGRKFKETEALTFSFMLSVPVSVASFVYMMLFGDMGGIPAALLLIAAISSFVFGYLSMGVLIKMARSLRFSKFCIILGGITIAFASCLLVL